MASPLLDTLLWRGARRRLRSGDPPTLPPSGSANASYVTTITRVGGDLGDSLRPVTDQLVAADPSHYRYPSGDLHITFALLAEVPPGERVPDSVVDGVRRAIEGHRRRRLDATGLNLTPTTVFATMQVDEELLALRKAIGRVALVDWAAPTGGGLFGRVAHRLFYTNLIRFDGPVDQALIDIVAGLRKTALGSALVDHVELVRTDKLLSEPATETIARFPLA